ncbi:helix-turn-helix domain-containing protein [Mesorhizobium sp. M0830]|uniref:helix-turn-helix domain-containing protein n=1 Tax=Mesorhizobium sp. M0830 TaxID=2957008 RepID=UPI0033359C6A
MSLDALARRAGLSKGTVVAIEQAKANPSVGVLCRLAFAFSLSVTDLLGQTSEENHRRNDRTDQTSNALVNPRKGARRN